MNGSAAALRKRARDDDDCGARLVTSLLTEGDRNERYEVQTPLGVDHGHFFDCRGRRYLVHRSYMSPNATSVVVSVWAPPPPPSEPEPEMEPPPYLGPPTLEEAAAARRMEELARAARRRADSDRAFDAAVARGDVDHVGTMLDGEDGERLQREMLGGAAGVKGGLKMVKFLLGRGVLIKKAAVLRIAKRSNIVADGGRWTEADVELAKGLDFPA